jgi:serine/threonine-protein kinase
MSAAEPSHHDALIGRTIGGKFEIESLIGRGGMGAVYKAKQKNLKRVVAIKVLRQELLSDPSYAARFKREANAASQLDHPNLMRVIDFGEDDGVLYIAMEFIDGKPLNVTLRDEPTPETFRVIDLTSQLLAALAAMHDAGIIHRDLKPENVMIVRGKDDDGVAVDILKLCDFGISKQLPQQASSGDGLATHTATLTATGALVGTPEYMSPEQAKGDTVDARSDLYACGVILYQMLTGRLPFKSANSMKLLLAHISEKPALPSVHAKDVDPALEAVCMRALAKSPADRFANAREMRNALRDALGLRDSAVLGNRRAVVRGSSMPPPPNPVVASEPPPAAVHDKAAQTDVVTRRAPETSGESTRPEAPSGSGIVEKQRPSLSAQQTSTLASGSAPSETTPNPPKSVEAQNSVAPPPETEPVRAPVQVAPQSSRAVPLLIGIVVLLLIVIFFLATKK